MSTYQQLWTTIVVHINQFRDGLREGAEPVWIVLAGLLILLVAVLFATLKSAARRVGAVRADHAATEERDRETQARLQTQVAHLDSTLGELREQYALLQGKYEESEHRRAESEHRRAESEHRCLTLEHQNSSLHTGLAALGKEHANLASHVRTQSGAAEGTVAGLQRQLTLLQARHEEAGPAVLVGILASILAESSA